MCLWHEASKTHNAQGTAMLNFENLNIGVIRCRFYFKRNSVSSWPSMCEANPLKIVWLPVICTIYPGPQPSLGYQRGLRLSNPNSIISLSLAFPLIRKVDRVNPMLNFENQLDQQSAAIHLAAILDAEFHIQDGR